MKYNFDQINRPDCKIITVMGNRHLIPLICVLILTVAILGCTGWQIEGWQIEQNLNHKKEQYPEIDFNNTAPDEQYYALPYDVVWEQIPKLFDEMGELVDFVNKTDGLIHTKNKYIKKTSYLSVEYKYRVIVSNDVRAVKVAVNVPVIEKHFGVTTQTNSSNLTDELMRHIFFKGLEEKLSGINLQKEEDIQKKNKSISIHNDDASFQAIIDNKTISDLQKKLKEIGYNPGPVDNIFGKRTRRAVRRFQKDIGLPVTGKPDLKFWKILLEFNPD